LYVQRADLRAEVENVIVFDESAPTIEGTGQGEKQRECAYCEIRGVASKKARDGYRGCERRRREDREKVPSDLGRRGAHHCEGSEIKDDERGERAVFTPDGERRGKADAGRMHPGQQARTVEVAFKIVEGLAGVALERPTKPLENMSAKVLIQEAPPERHRLV